MQGHNKIMSIILEQKNLFIRSSLLITDPIRIDVHDISIKHSINNIYSILFVFSHNQNLGQKSATSVRESTQSQNWRSYYVCAQGLGRRGPRKQYFNIVFAPLCTDAVVSFKDAKINDLRVVQIWFIFIIILNHSYFSMLLSLH